MPRGKSAETPDATPARVIPPPPGWFVVADDHDWIVCDDPDIPDQHGLAIYVRTSITNREQQRLHERHAEITEYATAWRESDNPDWDDTPDSRLRALVAPYVVGWNARGYNEESVIVDLPPPAEAGPEIFDAIKYEAWRWIFQVVLYGYLATGKAGGWQRPSTEPGDTPEPSATPDSTS